MRSIKHKHLNNLSTLSLASLLPKCNSVSDFKTFHAAIIRANSHQDSFLINQFISAWSRFHSIDPYVHCIFSQMTSPNVFVYNALIAGYVRWITPSKALDMYSGLIKSDLTPTNATFSSLLKACIQLEDLNLGKQIHGSLLKEGLAANVFVQTALVDLYSNFYMMDESTRAFDEMPLRDEVAWTAMISGHARVGDMDSARRLFEQMPEKTLASWNTIIKGYAKIGDVESAAYLFHKMVDRNLITWTTMISCYSQNKFFKEAVDTFGLMKDSGITPDGVTVATVISACAHLGALYIGKEIHYYAMFQGLSLDVYIGSALIDMYAKCGLLERSLLTFYKLKEKNLFCWNAVIEGLAAHGHCREALGMFCKMRKNKIEANNVSFVSVLSACVHGGLVEEGREVFSQMTKEHSILPEIEHYGCMVDLLARAGLVQEAFDMILTMDLKPNAAIWGALLGGCKVHGNFELGVIALENLVMLEPQNSGYHTLILNMFAEASEWNEVEKFRNLMKNRGVEKDSPGRSWI